MCSDLETVKSLVETFQRSQIPDNRALRKLLEVLQTAETIVSEFQERKRMAWLPFELKRELVRSQAPEMAVGVAGFVTAEREVISSQADYEQAVVCAHRRMFDKQFHWYAC